MGDSGACELAAGPLGKGPTWCRAPRRSTRATGPCAGPPPSASGSQRSSARVPRRLAARPVTRSRRPRSPCTSPAGRRAEVRLCERLIAAHELARRLQPEPEGAGERWSWILANRQRVATALEQGDAPALAETMASMFVRDFVVGLAPGLPMRATESRVGTPPGESGAWKGSPRWPRWWVSPGREPRTGHHRAGLRRTGPAGAVSRVG